MHIRQKKRNKESEKLDSLLKAKEMIEDFRQEHNTGHPMFTDDDIDRLSWLVQQAEWADFYGKKAGKLNVFLQERVTGRVGDNVIDVAIDYIKFLEKELKGK